MNGTARNEPACRRSCCSRLVCHRLLRWFAWRWLGPETQPNGVGRPTGAGRRAQEREQAPRSPDALRDGVARPSFIAKRVECVRLARLAGALVVTFGRATDCQFGLPAGARTERGSGPTRIGQRQPHPCKSGSNLHAVQPPREMGLPALLRREACGVRPACPACRRSCCDLWACD